MKTQKKTAVIVGVLFLVALVPNIIANEMINNLIYSAGYLAHIAVDENKLIIGNLLNIICAIAMIFIPLALYSSITPRFKKIVTGYAVFRSLEGILFFIVAIKTLSFLGLSNELRSDKISAESAYNLGSLIHAEIHWTTIIYLVSFCSGAILFYSLLFKSNLVPRWLSLWGLIGVIILASGTFCAVFGIGVFETMPQMKGMAYFAPPIALNEFVLSIWLLVKGFNQAPATAAETNS